MLFFVLLKNSQQTLLKQTFLSVLTKKKVWKRVKLFIPAGQAKVAPPISSILGQFGVNLLDFCDSFNLRTRQFNPELTFLVYITIFSNKSYVFKLKPLTLNELFFSFNIFSCISNHAGSLLQNKKFILNLYKLFTVFIFANHGLNILLNLQTKFLDNNLNQIFGYFFSFSKNLKFLSLEK